MSRSDLDPGPTYGPPAERPQPWHGLITADAALLDLFARVERVASSRASVLIRGETGTGKEHIARALHALSGRAQGPFRAVNCATFTPELLASELFGHVRGAFTGAVRDRKGLFELAHQGTLFLDEIGEMPLAIQAQLLRVLQERTFVPVGGTEPIQVDVRLVTATHRALRAEVEAGRFRADLMYRVRVVPLYLPPLRARIEDVEPLLWHFIEAMRPLYPRRIEAVRSETLDLLQAHDWPGNVRELQNVVEYALAVGESPIFEPEDLTPELRGEGPPAEARLSPRAPLDSERQRLVAALQTTGGRRAEAAAHLGLSRSTLWRKLREHGLA